MIVRYLALAMALAFSFSANARREKVAHPVLPTIVQPSMSCAGDTDGYSEWLQTDNSLQGEPTPVLISEIFEISEDRRAVAVRLLDQLELMELSSGQFQDLTGERLVAQKSMLMPFLIRNVVPQFKSYLGTGSARLDRRGNGLQISAGLFGCGGFKKNPIIILLPNSPQKIDMRVSAIW